jgi:hypothetical protein
MINSSGACVRKSIKSPGLMYFKTWNVFSNRSMLPEMNTNKASKNLGPAYVEVNIMRYNE